MTLRALTGFSDVAGEFDGFILDLWGLVHDGATAYPCSADTFRQLKAAGKKTLLLSNAPRRASVARCRSHFRRELPNCSPDNSRHRSTVRLATICEVPDRGRHNRGHNPCANQSGRLRCRHRKRTEMSLRPTGRTERTAH